MGQLFTFHKSVRGQGHINRGAPCEDSSLSFSDEQGRYHIAIIADGHGQALSFRSKIGSRIIAEVTLECLKSLAESAFQAPEGVDRFYRDILTNPRYRQMMVRQLTDTIVAKWHDGIKEDYQTNPPSEEELGDHAELLQDERHIPKVYGTTVIAVLRLPGCMLMIHQGDGRCVAFYDDGSVDMPIPWDDRCQGNVTTSMCDEDAADSFRHCVIDLNRKNVIACYVGSDGVEDAYRSDEGTYTFYRDLTCSVLEKHDSDLDEYLEEMLSHFSGYGRFSKTGSQDDVSVSGIVDLDETAKLADAFRTQVQRFAIGEDLFWKEDELRSKTRSHEILKRRMEEAREELRQAEAALPVLEQKRDYMTEQLVLLEKKIRELDVLMKEERQEFQELGNCLETDTEPDDASFAKYLSKLKKFPGAVKAFLADIRLRFSEQESQFRELSMRQQNLITQIGLIKNQIEQKKAEIEPIREKAQQAEEKFSEVDTKYQAIASEIQKLKDQIAALSAPDQP